MSRKLKIAGKKNIRNILHNNQYINIHTIKVTLPHSTAQTNQKKTFLHNSK